MLKFTCCGEVSQFSSQQQAQLLRGIQRGYERECLRVGAGGKLALTPHPAGLGSKLTHPWITTDYSEALLEFITPPSDDPAFPLQFLREIHRFSAAQLKDEVMWAGSMPCLLGTDAQIPLADYGTSNSAKMKYVYREGLGLRYGRQMQTIAGAHYNWSLSQAFWESLHTCCKSKLSLQDFISERYFGLIRNFLRFGWLIPYLFGASPAICESFLQGRKSDLEQLIPGTSGTLYGRYATSLRMSDLGYQNRAQDKLHVSFNSLLEYTTALESAIRTPDPFYEEMGVKSKVDGHWQQLSANLLQVENEFYAGIRPKRIGKHGERPAKALQTYGVEYVEVRLFDLNPMVDIGITPEQSTFADVLLMMCLFRESPPITSREQSENDENKRRIVNRGRQPDLHLLVHNREQPFRPIAHELFDDMAPFARMLDAAYGGERYTTTMQSLRQRIDNPDLTPSAQVLAAAKAQGGYFKYAKHMAEQHHANLLAEPLDAATTEKFVASVQVSLAEQKALEAQDQGSFEGFVAKYFQ
ncbi:MAG: glutamate--cysteine ligase [Burkholderiaceae bacterium]|nr:glutamate--cysteine ligase [Burkholderiaceae bacterium]